MIDVYQTQQEFINLIIFIFAVIIICTIVTTIISMMNRRNKEHPKEKKPVKLKLDNPTQEEINHVLNWLYHNGHITFKEHEKMMNRAHSWIE